MIRQPVPGSRHTKGDIDFGSSFEIAKDQKRPVKKRKEKLFDEKKRAIDQGTLNVYVKANPVPDEVEVEAEVSDTEVVDPLLEAELLTKTPSDDEESQEDPSSMGMDPSEPSVNTSSPEDSPPEESSHKSGNETAAQNPKRVKRNMQK